MFYERQVLCSKASATFGTLAEHEQWSYFVFVKLET